MKAKYIIGIMSLLMLSGITVKAQYYDGTYYGNDGAQVIVNNYYDDYDFYYSSRINRFHRSYVAFDYYSPVYTDTYWYTYTPLSWGISIYSGGLGFTVGYNFYFPVYRWYDPFYYSYWNYYPVHYGTYYWGYSPFVYNSWYIPYVAWHNYGWSGFYCGWNNNYYHNYHNYYSRWDYSRPVYYSSHGNYLSEYSSSRHTSGNERSLSTSESKPSATGDNRRAVSGSYSGSPERRSASVSQTQKNSHVMTERNNQYEQRRANAQVSTKTEHSADRSLLSRTTNQTSRQSATTDRQIVNRRSSSDEITRNRNTSLQASANRKIDQLSVRGQSSGSHVQGKLSTSQPSKGDLYVNRSSDRTQAPDLRNQNRNSLGNSRSQVNTDFQSSSGRRAPSSASISAQSRTASARAVSSSSSSREGNISRGNNTPRQDSGPYGRNSSSQSVNGRRK